MSKIIKAGSVVTWTGVMGNEVVLPIGIDMTSEELDKFIASYNWGSEMPAPDTIKIDSREETQQ